MSIHDIAVYSSDERRILVVEIKSRKDSEPEQLERARRVLMSEAATRNALFFLLAQRDGLYLWKNGAASGTSSEVAPVKGLLREYVPSVPEGENAIPKSGMEIVIHAWLDDLALGIRRPKPESEADQLLVSTGVYDQIRNGRVVAENIA